MLIFFLVVTLLGLSTPIARAEDQQPDGRRAQAMDAFNRGEDLSWDQLEVVATEAGVSREQIAEMKLKDRAERLIRSYHLPLEVSGFSGGMNADEEFRLYRGRRPGYGAILFNADFWSHGMQVYDNDPYMTYLLFRAQAYYIYRSHYDSEHCAWIVEEESPSMEVLKTALNGSETDWPADNSAPSGRDLEFRRSIDPSGNASKTLKGLIEYALRAVAQKAADNWAIECYRQHLGVTSPLVTQRINQRERILAAEFNRARNAMTRPERLAFQRLLKSPFRYTRGGDNPATEPVFDPTTTPAP